MLRPEKPFHCVEIPTHQPAGTNARDCCGSTVWAVFFASGLLVPIDKFIGPHRRHRIGIGNGTGLQNHLLKRIICPIHKRRKLAKGRVRCSRIGVPDDDLEMPFYVFIINIGQNRVGIVPANGSHQDLHVIAVQKFVEFSGARLDRTGTVKIPFSIQVPIYHANPFAC